MFLNHLTEPQRPLFVRLAWELIGVDQHASKAEVVLLDHMEREMGFSSRMEPPANGQQVERADLARQFPDRRSRAVVLLELIGLSYADGQFSDREYAFIRDLAHTLGVSKGERLAMENWVVRQLDLYREASEFWLDEG